MGCLEGATESVSVRAPKFLASRFRPPRPTLGSVTAPVAPKSRLVAAAWLVGIGIWAPAVVVMSVGFARSKAAGDVYHESAVPPSPVALVLGAQVKPDGTPSAFLTARLDLAKRLYDVGRVDQILAIRRPHGARDMTNRPRCETT